MKHREQHKAGVWRQDGSGVYGKVDIYDVKGRHVFWSLVVPVIRLLQGKVGGLMGMTRSDCL